MVEHPLEQILHPNSIAVVGTSGPPGNAPYISPMVEQEFKRPIYPN